MLTGRYFQPWEGGEGRVLAAWEEAHLSLARRALAGPEILPPRSSTPVRLSTRSPNLGEARHALANTADLHLVLGDALAAAGEPDGAGARGRVRRRSRATSRGCRSTCTPSGPQPP